MKVNKIAAVSIMLILAGARVAPVFAYVMESAHFRIQRDSINAGGALSTSTDYNLEDTFGESGTGVVTSTSYNLFAGYQQMDEQKYLALTAPTGTILSPSIHGVSGGYATGTSDVGVLTNNSLGYTLLVSASSSPAMNRVGGGDNFADYAPSGGIPDFNWSIASSASAFGFTPQGPDIVARYLDNGSACNQTGGSDTHNACWDGFSTTSTAVSVSNAGNDPGGATTTLYLQAQSGPQHIQTSGTYDAFLTVTAYMN